MQKNKRSRKRCSQVTIEVPVERRVEVEVERRVEVPVTQYVEVERTVEVPHAYPVRSRFTLDALRQAGPSKRADRCHPP